MQYDGDESIGLGEDAIEEVAETEQNDNRVTWGYLKSWADQNGVTDDAYIFDEDTGDVAMDLSFNRADPAEREPASLAITFGDPDDE